MATHSNILAGESYGQRSLAGCGPCGHMHAGGPAGKTQCSHCLGSGSVSGQGTKIPQVLQCSRI